MVKKEPAPEQLKRLLEFAKEHGRAWRYDLDLLWCNGRDANERDGHLLRQIRNQLGPSWLAAFKEPK